VESVTTLYGNRRRKVTEDASALQHYFIARDSFIAARPLNLPKLALFDLCWQGKDTWR